MQMTVSNVITIGIFPSPKKRTPMDCFCVSCYHLKRGKFRRLIRYHGGSQRKVFIPFGLEYTRLVVGHGWNLVFCHELSAWFTGRIQYSNLASLWAGFRGRRSLVFNPMILYRPQRPSVWRIAIMGKGGFWTVVALLMAEATRKLRNQSLKIGAKLYSFTSGNSLVRMSEQKGSRPSQKV